MNLFTDLYFVLLIVAVLQCLSDRKCEGLGVNVGCLKIDNWKLHNFLTNAITKKS